jgi:hypothetical protein
MNEIPQALSQLLNALCGGFSDESLSAKAHRSQYKRRRWKLWVAVIDRLFFWEQQHCYNAYLREQERRRIPPENRDG